MRILAVDGNIKALQQLVESLEKAFPESVIISFTDPMMAVRYFFNNPVDVVYTEVLMKHMDGFKLMEGLRSCPGSVPVFIVTDNDKYKDLALLRGASGYLLKPVTFEKLQETVNNSVW